MARYDARDRAVTPLLLRHPVHVIVPCVPCHAEPPLPPKHQTHPHVYDFIS